jgi:hypothetical protein
MMNVSINIEEESGISRKSQPVSLGVPVSKGLIFDRKILALQNDLKNVINCQIEVLEFWPDKSVKWIILYFKVDIKSNCKVSYYLTNTLNKNESKGTLSLTNNEYSVNINTGKTSVNISKTPEDIYSLYLNSNKDKGCSALSIKLVDDKDKSFDAVIQKFWFEKDDSNSSEKKDIFIEGVFSSSRQNQLKFQSKITFFSDISYFKLDFTLHNPQAADHEGGLWDLGDISSINFKSLAVSLTFPCESKAVMTDLISNDKIIFEQNFHIQQFSSGGEQWNSPIHKDASGNVDLGFNGYKISETNAKQTGKRIHPSIELTSDKNVFCAYIENFWQNFPKAITKKDNALILELFPEGNFELQAGEKKTHSVWLDFDAKNQNFDWVANPLNVTLEPVYITSTCALEYFSNAYPEDELLKIIANGVHGKNCFFEKREQIDEFGWRNFGELYADHEATGYQGSELFISHYNNQYDPLFGFIYQFYLTGDKKWFVLADDLAKHITDIDIYHTVNDKDEYNGGLFWHTDHYLDASTCTHRTFSINHQAAYEGYTSGGGPGGQHCYTTGLKCHYLLTGDENSKKAVLQLADWITYSFEGSNRFLAKLFAIKQSGNPGVKDHVLEQYPMDRGTGHYIIALLDAYDLTQKSSYLTRAFRIITHTFHPNDDICLRNFDNIEVTWFYTVFLQAVGRFLSLKEQMNQLDDDFYYARDAMLHYADWMLVNELPYLEQKDKLEFPNTTWVGQDLRKVGIFYMANYYSSVKNEAMVEKGNYFYHYIVNTLEKDSNNDFTRVLALLMQNIGLSHFYKNASCVDKFESIRKYSNPIQKNKTIKILKLLVNELSRLSIKRELKWLSLRSAKVAKLLGNKG